MGIVVCAVLIVALMQLIPSIFLLFSHYTSGKYSKNKASDLVLFFTLGVESMTVLMIAVIYFVLNALFSHLSINNNIWAWVWSGILIALAILYFVFYFGKSDGTRLFISRKCAKNFQHKITTVKKRSDAFVLGLVSVIPETVFTLPVYVVLILKIMLVGENPFARAGLIILAVLIVLLPLAVIRVVLDSGRNLADVQKYRVKNKTFLKFVVGILYIILAILIIMETA
ncbi:hypothetical protein IKF67_02355 [Candidatus Saccharibacteria bacterium]|nr:hypothetical protein [Candidatus Saccharibacteria bacterium]